MSKVILLSDSSTLGGEFGNMRYMGPYAIAAQLRKDDISVSIIDFFTRIPNFFEYIQNFITPETRVIGISSTFLAPLISIHEKRKSRQEGWNRYSRGELCFETGDELVAWVKKLKQTLRSISPTAKIVLGGVKAQSAIWSSEYYTDFDYVCIGAADKTFSQFCQALIRGEEPEYSTHLGIRHLSNILDRENKFCPRALFSAKDAVMPGEALPIEISRGCVFNCKFCHYDKKESFRKDLDTLREEMISNYENFGTTVYNFCDDCFNDHPKKVESYCNLFLSLPFKIQWSSYARVDVAVKFPHTIDLMVASGAKGLFWGLESFDEEVARNAGKGTPTEKVKEFLLDFRKKYKDECLSEGSFIVGLPGETKESNLQTLDWIIKNDALDMAHFAPLSISPYIQKLDKVLYDYADYSRNPEKYGFQEVSFKPRYWRHEKMDFIEARTLAEHMTNSWREYRKPGILQTIFIYSHARSLGYDQKQVFDLFRSQLGMHENSSEFSRRFKQFCTDYHKQLLQSRLQTESLNLTYL